MKLSAPARRIGVALAIATGLAIIPSLPASAHVTVSSTDATPGGFGKIVFRVPSESDTANTTSVTIELPASTPFAFVSTGVVPGWTAATTSAQLPEPLDVDGFTVTEAVTTVTWTATDERSALHPGEFAEFALSAGPFPSDVDDMVFVANQSYSDGEVVAWSDPTVEGEDEPARPAPVLSLVAAPGATDAGTGTSDTLARVLGGVGLAFGLVSFGWVAATRRLRSS